MPSDSDNNNNTHCCTLHEVWSGTLVYEHSLHYCSLSTATRLSSVHTASVKLATWSTQHMGEPCWCCTVDRVVRHRWPSSSRPPQGQCWPGFQGLLQRPSPRRGCSYADGHCIQILSPYITIHFWEWGQVFHITEVPLPA